MNLTNMEPRARDTGCRVDTAAAVDPRGAVGTREDMPRGHSGGRSLGKR